MILIQTLRIYTICFTSCCLIFVNSWITTNWKNTYDYIIVGGGTAGCVLANRLSDDPENTVLLLEAGENPDDNPFIPVPYTFASVFNNPKLSWGYFTEKQKYTGTKEKVPVLRAKMLGGCSAHNVMQVVQGSSFDYDRWSELGNGGWSYDEVLPYFKKLESVLDSEITNDFRGTSGPVKVKVCYKTAEIEEVLKGVSDLGFATVSDYNRPDVNGFGWAQFNVNDKGHRMSTLEAYLKPVLGRQNLHVVVNAFVTKIDVRKSTKSKKNKAVRVYFKHNGNEHHVKAGKEVIVSAGAINSPQILMLSGIGPKHHLKKIGIPVLKNLPVGRNLQDHNAVQIPIPMSDRSFIPRRKIHTFENLFKYIFTGKGPWSSSFSGIINFYNSRTQSPNDRFPYMEEIISGPTLNSKLENSLRNGSGIISEVDGPGPVFTKHLKLKLDVIIVKDLQALDRGPRFVNALLVHLHCRSTGIIKLKNNDPETSPIIDFQLAQNEKDIDDIVEGIRRVQKLMNTTVLQDAGFILPLKCLAEGCSSLTFDTDDYWNCCVKFTIRSMSHYAGTCKMAKDKTGVVDEYLRVKGIDNLRVVDASIMPMIPSGHLNIPTIMIAEKAADLIKGST